MSNFSGSSVKSLLGVSVKRECTDSCPLVTAGGSSHTLSSVIDGYHFVPLKLDEKQFGEFLKLWIVNITYTVLAGT